MAISRKWLWILLALLAVAAVLVRAGLNSLNDYQRSGELRLKGLKHKVRVVRDEKGMAYIFARDADDVFFAQGFVTAQDRLFSMEVVRRLASGRLAEVFGEKLRDTDIRMRTIGFYRQAQKHAALLGPDERRMFQRYVDGVNAYIGERPDSIHLKLKIAGIRPIPWKIADSLVILYYMGWGASANLQDEIISQLLVEKLGPELAAELFPMNVNPDDPSGRPLRIRFDPEKTLGPSSSALSALMPTADDRRLAVGSNNWVIAPKLSRSGKALLANDPHLDTRVIPGPFYPVGLITPGFRAVGVMVPGLPAMVIGRTQHVALGVTNGYGDTQDLYVETVDPENPDHYLEGKRSLPFEIITEKLRIKDKRAKGGFREETVKIRRTKRGPVVSDIFPALKGSKVFSLRWSAFESMGPALGFLGLLKARDVSQAREALRHLNAIMLNFVLADTGGNIAWQTSGRLPIRRQGDGTLPYVVRDGRDNWQGWIPWDQMPHSVNPEKGWTGTCNQTTVTNDFPYYFSSHFAPSWRIRRLTQLISAPGKKSVDDCWRFQRDTRNVMAERVAPILAATLGGHPETRFMGEILGNWDYEDDPQQVAPSIFQVVMWEVMLRTFKDELGPELTMTMAKDWYYWQERLVNMIVKNGDSPWFDDTLTNGKRESLEDIIFQSGLAAGKYLSERFGDDINKWVWGDLHRIVFVSAIRRSGFGRDLLGGGSLPMPGSGETLMRGLYLMDKPYNAAITAALRMVVDFNDPDRIAAVLPCGVSGRLLDPHRTDQTRDYMDGRKRYWWFSDGAIARHAKSELALLPSS